MIIILSTSALLDINKFTFSIENDGISSKLIAKQWDNAIYRYPQGVKYPYFWPKMTPNVGIIQIISILDHLIMQSNHKYTFTTKHDGISSKLIA